MGWLFGYMIASLVGALLVVRFLEYAFSWVQVGVLAGTAKVCLFVSTWTAITASSGVRDYSARVRQLHKTASSVSRGLDDLSTKPSGGG